MRRGLVSAGILLGAGALLASAVPPAAAAVDSANPQKCAQTLAAAQAKHEVWAQPTETADDGVAASYLPVLASHTKVVQDPLNPTCSGVKTTWQSVKKSGAGAGFLVLRSNAGFGPDAPKCGHDTCTVEYRGETIDLKDPKQTKPLLCSRVAFAPDDYDRSLCLPVAKSTGAYEVSVVQKDTARTIPGVGTRWACRDYGPAIACSWQPQLDTQVPEKITTESIRLELTKDAATVSTAGTD